MSAQEFLFLHDFTKWCKLCEMSVSLCHHTCNVPLPLLRLQGHGLLQRAVWLPVAHLTFLGWPSGAASAGGPARSAGAHGQRGERQPAMSDSWFHCGGAGRVAARTAGKKSIYYVQYYLDFNVRSWLYVFETKDICDFLPILCFFLFDVFECAYNTLGPGSWRIVSLEVRQLMTE